LLYQEPVLTDSKIDEAALKEAQFRRSLLELQLKSEKQSGKGSPGDIPGDTNKDGVIDDADRYTKTPFESTNERGEKDFYEQNTENMKNAIDGLNSVFGASKDNPLDLEELRQLAVDPESLVKDGYITLPNRGKIPYTEGVVA